MDRACEGDDIRNLATALGFRVVVPPHPYRRKPWAYDRERYRWRNAGERQRRRLKDYHRLRIRLDKLDMMYGAFVLWALIFEALRLM